MLNTKQDDTNILTLIAPAGGVVAGVPRLVGGLLTVPITDAAAGESFAGKRDGVFTLPKENTTAMAAGLHVEWDITAGEVIAVGGVAGDFPLGNVVTAAADTDTECEVALVGGNVVVNT